MTRDKWLKDFEADPPEHLSDRAKELWHAAVPSQIRCRERLALLQSGLEALDRADAAKRIIDEQGMTTMTARSGVMHVHPLLKVEKDARQQFLSIWSALSMNKMEIMPPRHLHD